MKPRRPLPRFLSHLLPAAGLVLNHHRVGEPSGDRERELVPALSTGSFEERLELLRERFRVVPASEILEAARARRRGQPVPVALTFDDDLSSHLDVVAPILLRVDLPATFYVGPPLPSGEAFWWEDLQALADGGKLPPRLASLPETDLAPVARRVAKAIHEVGLTIEALPPDRHEAVVAELHELAGTNGSPRLGAEAMSELVRLGFELGFHTRRHYLLTTLDDELLACELVDGKDVVEEVAGRSIPTIAYPYGKADARVSRAARAAGFDIGFTAGSRFERRIDRRTDPLLVPRMEVHDVPIKEFEGCLDRVLSNRG